PARARHRPGARAVARGRRACAHDWSLAPAAIDASCKSEIESAGKRVDAMLRVRSARTFKSVAEPLENALSDLNDDLAAQTLLFQVSPDATVREASEKCN